MKKYILPLAIVLVLSFGYLIFNYKGNQPQEIGGLWLDATRTIDIDTSDWVTFTNTKYGYTLSYPKEIDLDKNNYEFLAEPELSYRIFFDGLWIMATTKDIDRPLFEYVEDYWQQNKDIDEPGEKITSEKIEEIVIDGEPGFSFFTTNYFVGGSPEFIGRLNFVDKWGYRFWLVTSSQQGVKILETFQFVEPQENTSS